VGVLAFYERSRGIYFDRYVLTREADLQGRIGALRRRPTYFRCAGRSTVSRAVPRAAARRG